MFLSRISSGTDARSTLSSGRLSERASIQYVPGARRVMRKGSPHGAGEELPWLEKNPYRTTWLTCTSSPALQDADASVTFAR